MIGRLNHVALVVDDLDAATATYRDTLGAVVSEPQPLPDHGVTVVFVDLENTRIELLEPHICLEVDDITAAAEQLLTKGARILGDGKPKIGAHGNPVLFLNPKDFHGCLLELEHIGTNTAKL